MEAGGDVDAASDFSGWTTDVASRSQAQSNFTIKPGIGTLTYTWDDIQVSKPDHSKPILNGVSGIAYPFEALAIMGSSGAGKTTLLNVLTATKASGLVVKGRRCLNGQPVTADILTAVSAYVHQDDLFIPSLKVREHLNFVARVRMRGSSAKARRDRVEEVMMELGLLKCADTKIGLPGWYKGISGGEMRRLSFASEILTDPQILFCDEPTSGLDSFMSQSIVHMIKNLAMKGRTIICTIHQPSSKTYSMFDKICYMAEGRVAYLGSLPGALQFFSGVGYPCPSNYSACDHIIQLLAIHPNDPEKSRQTVTTVCDAYAKGPYFGALKDAISEAHDQTAGEEGELLKSRKISRFKTSWCNQFWAVLGRSFLSLAKDPAMLAARTVTTIVVALMIGVVFWDQQTDQPGVIGINGSLFVVTITMSIQNCFAVAAVLCLETPVFYREYGEGLYRSEVYVLAKTFSELPMFAFLPVLFGTIVWYMVGYGDEFERLLTFVIVLVLLCNVAVSFGYVIAAACDSLSLTLVVLPVAVLPSVVFSGFLIVPKAVNLALRWMHYTSWNFYSWEIFGLNQWQSVSKIDCPKKLRQHCLHKGQDVLDQYDLEEDDVPLDYAMLVVLAVGLRVLAWAILAIRACRTRS